MNKPSTSRRDFLKLTLDSMLAFGGLLGLGGLIRFLSYKTDPPQPTEFDLGLADNYKPDSKTTLPEVPAVLIHNNAGFTALSLVCTHLGDRRRRFCHEFAQSVESVTAGSLPDATLSGRTDLSRSVFYPD